VNKIKAAANVANLARKDAVGFSRGKKWVEIMAARLSKI
jgi:hypothetical protein